MIPIDREGIFKVKPMAWRVRRFESKAVGIEVDFLITAQLNAGNEWDDWTGYEDHAVAGTWFVIKKTGEANPGAIEQLIDSMMWDCSLVSIDRLEPPDLDVQVTVKADEYKGKVRYRATWMNPGDYQPTGGGATTAEVQELDRQFGGILRAVRGGAPAPKKAAPKRAPRQIEPEDDPFEAIED